MANPLVVDVRSAQAATTSVVLAAFSPTPVAAGVILVCMGTYLGVAASQHQAPTDNYSNTYTLLGSIDQANVSLSLWKAINIATGAAHVVTGHVGVAANVIAMAWALDIASDVNADFLSAVEAVGNVPSIGPSTPAPAANSMFLAFLGSADTPDHGVPTSWNAQGVNGFTAAMQATTRAFIHAGFAAPNMYGAYFIASTVQTATWQNAIATLNGAAVMVSVKPAAPPDPLASMTWFPTFPDFVPHRKIWADWQPTSIIAPPLPPPFWGGYPDKVPHTPQFRPVGGSVQPPTPVTIPVPDILATRDFFPTYPSIVPHRRLGADQMPSVFAPPPFSAQLGPTWLPVLPDPLPHKRLSAAAMPSLFLPPPGELIRVAASLTWLPVAPDQVSHHKPPNPGGMVEVLVPGVTPGTVPPGICVTLRDVGVSFSHLTQVAVTQSGAIDAGVTFSHLVTVGVC